MTRARLILGLSIALSIPALCIVVLHPYPTTVTEWRFDVTSQASLEADCGRAPDLYRSIGETGGVHGEAGVVYGANQVAPVATHVGGFREAYRVFVSFASDVQGEAPHGPFEFMADNFLCDFTNDLRWLRLGANTITKGEIIRIMRAIGGWARVPGEKTDGVIHQFELGELGVDLFHPAGDQHPYADRVSDLRLRLERPRLTIWFAIKDETIGSDSQPPAQVSQDEARYSIAIGFAPES